jgi:hypothetical protein
MAPEVDGVKPAVFDNPATLQREAWCDGRLLAAVSLETIQAIETKDRCAHRRRWLPFMLDCGPWHSGAIRGHAGGLASTERLSG